MQYKIEVTVSFMNIIRKKYCYNRNIGISLLTGFRLKAGHSLSNLTQGERSNCMIFLP